MPTSPRKAREINDMVRYTMWSVFRLRDLLGDGDRQSEAAEVELLFKELEAADEDDDVRGFKSLNSSSTSAASL